jgi:hypothetical protein
MKLDDIELPSNRKFGWFATVVSALLAAYYYYKGVTTVVWVIAPMSIAILLVTTTKPDLLLPLNKLWALIGFLCGRVVSPLVLGILYFLLFTPIALILRITGRDELRLKRNDRGSYWRERLPVGPGPNSFRDQF